VVTCRVIVSRHSSRFTSLGNFSLSVVFLNLQSKIPIPSGPSHPRNSFPHNPLSDPPLLNPYATIFYKNGGGTSFKPNVFLALPLSPILRTLFQVSYPVSPAFATLTKTPGVWGYSSHFGKPPESIAIRSRFLFKLFLFTLLQTLLHSRKTQLFYFQSIPNSFRKTPGVGGHILQAKRCFPLWSFPAGSRHSSLATVPYFLPRARISGHRAKTEVVSPPRGVNSPRTTHHSGLTAATMSRRILLTAFS